MESKDLDLRDKKLSDALFTEHPVSNVSKKFVQCWWVIFDVNGNAPSDAEVVPCATRSLADQVCNIFGRMKDADEKPFIVVKGKKHYELCHHSVEGYNFDTYYSVRKGWAMDETIIFKLAELATANVFDCEEDTDLPDGVYFADGEDTEEETE